MREDLIRELSQLSKEELLEISKCIHNFNCISNKSEKDTIIIRYLAFRGYHSFSEFYDKHNISKDASLGRTLKGENDSLSDLLKLKKELNIPNDLFLNYIDDVAGSVK